MAQVGVTKARPAKHCNNFPGLQRQHAHSRQQAVIHIYCQHAGSPPKQNFTMGDAIHNQRECNSRETHASK